MGLARVFADTVSYILLLKQTCAVRQPAFNEVNNKVRGLLKDAGAQVARDNIDPRAFDEARFALCAWIDETLLNLPWSHRDQWRKHMLQVELYGTNNAGEMFFDKLGALQPNQNDIKEVFFLCMSLGFMGRYCKEGDEVLLEQLQKASLRSLTGQPLTPVSYIKEKAFAAGYADEASVAATPIGPTGFAAWFNGPRLVYSLVPVVVVVLMYLVFNLVLNGLVEDLVGNVMGS